jgi:RNA polymerase sigma factor (sigma-70 family)
MRHSLRAVSCGARSRPAVSPPAIPGETKHKIEKGLSYLAFKLARPNVPQEDLLSEALRTIHYAYPLFDAAGGASLATYLLRCAYRAMIDYLRAEDRQTGNWVSADSPRGADREETLFDTLPGPSYQSPYYFMLLQQVELAVLELPDRQRQCLEMHYGDAGLSNSQIARHLGISRSRVSQLLSTAIHNLRAKFGVRRAEHASNFA